LTSIFISLTTSSSITSKTLINWSPLRSLSLPHSPLPSLLRSLIDMEYQQDPIQLLLCAIASPRSEYYSLRPHAQQWLCHSACLLRQIFLADRSVTNSLSLSLSLSPSPSLSLSLSLSLALSLSRSLSLSPSALTSLCVVDVDHEAYDPDQVAYQKFDLIRFRKKKVPKKTYKLLESFGKKDSDPSPTPALGAQEPLLAIGDQVMETSSLLLKAEETPVTSEVVATISDEKSLTQTESESEDGMVVPYWVPTLDLVLVEDMPETFGRNAIPSAILQHLTFNEIGNYYPVIYHNGLQSLSLSLS
jgi:hypothetical protein